MGWSARYGPVVIGCTAGVFGSKLFDGEPVAGRTVVMWLALTVVALVVTWLVYRWLEKAWRDSSSLARHARVPGSRGFRSPEALIALAMLNLGGHRPTLPGRK